MSNQLSGVCCFSVYKEIMVKYDGCSLVNISLYILSRESLTIGWQRSSFRKEVQRNDLSSASFNFPSLIHAKAELMEIISIGVHV